jgi:hypothetical protein
MTDLHLTDAQQDALVRTLRECLPDLHTEISHTDDRDFRARLRADEDALKAILEQLERRPAAV